MTCARYYLNPDGSLCIVTTAGRCERYWLLWSRRGTVEKALALRPDEPRLSQLKADHNDAEMALTSHLEICTACQAWLEECRAARFSTEYPEIELISV